jgi:HTH-type transcriptional regulator/antitoxin HigA
MLRKNAQQVYAPGDFIREELDERGWTQTQFSQVLGRPLQAINEILAGRKRITAETALQIAAAFGTSPELWLSLENAYRLSIARKPDPKIAKRAKSIAR